MSTLRRYRRGLQPKNVKTAGTMARLLAVEPDMKKLRENFQQVFEQVYMPRQTQVEVFEAAKSAQG